ncbi:hypothetical protein MKW98_012567 [Papaver atlanticum]|uniref:Protein kinase domain-containing protein n=1 Tax=Papaver atlanticum TaxID=357466 RepID=A0AAD4T278_9MAGN|nr:hypothetical protein MKW98_012567 [Papaver atlanticum]
MERFLHEIAKEKIVRFTAQELYSFTNNYSIRLGSGSFGIVYEEQFPNGIKIAVKVLNRNSNNKKVEEQFMAEVGTIGKTYHINLVRLYGFCFDHLMSALVYEYMENSSLDKFLFSAETPQIEWEQLQEIAIGTAKGLAYLHEECQQRIIHYDIKPGNVLLDLNFSPKVADFGLAKLCNRDITHVSCSGYRGTPGYSAPEFLMHGYPITHKCDVYSFGMLLFEIARKRRNTNTNTDTDSLDWFPEKAWEEFEKDGLKNLITMEINGIEDKDKEKVQRMFMVALWCVQDTPASRPLMSTVVKMLEGGVEILPPPNPFRYLHGLGTRNVAEDTTVSSSYSTIIRTNSSWHESTTPVMRKYEIRMASSGDIFVISFSFC